MGTTFRRSWRHSGREPSPAAPPCIITSIRAGVVAAWLGLALCGVVPLAPAGAEPVAVALLPPPKVAFVRWSDPAAAPLDRPVALARDRHGHLYVIDAGHDRIVVFDHDDRLLGAWGSPGNDAGQFRFHRPESCWVSDRSDCAPDSGGGVAVDGQDRVYVADYGNNRVQVFDHHGRLLAGWGREGGEPGEFRRPSGIAVDAHSQVYVGDAGNQRVQVFDATGAFVRQWGGSGTGPGQFIRPGGLAVDGEGHILVADACNQRVQRFDPAGNYLDEWALPTTDQADACAARI